MNFLLVIVAIWLVGLFLAAGIFWQVAASCMLGWLISEGLVRAHGAVRRWWVAR